MALEGIAAEVTKPMVGILLEARSPDVLERTYGAPPEPMFDAHVQQVAAEVIAVCGTDPQGAARALAVQCIAYGVGSAIEYAAFPEQQTAGNIGRGWFLKQRFNELLEALRKLPKSADAGAAGASRARFPAARRYPDPMRDRTEWWRHR